MASLVIRYVRDFWINYPEIKDPTYLCKYFRKSNKYIPLEFVLLTFSTATVGTLYSLTFFIGKHELIDDFIRGSPIFILYAVANICLSFYTFSLKRQSEIKEFKTNLSYQISINRKLMICPASIFIWMIIITIDSVRNPNSFISVCHCWVMCLLGIIYSALLFIDDIKMKVIYLCLFNIIFCYMVSDHPDFSAATLGRMVAPSGFGSVFFLGYDRIKKITFILKQKVKEQKMLYEEFLYKFTDSVLIFDHDHILFQNDIALMNIGNTISDFNNKSAHIVSTTGSTLQKEITKRLNNQVTIEHKSTKEKYFQLNEENDQNECQKVLLVTIIESRAFSNGKTIGIILHDMTVEFTEEKKRVDERFRNMTLYSLSHELRTPLNILQGALLLGRQIKNKSVEDRKCYLSAKSAWNYMRNKINDTLVYAQILTNEFVLHADSFNLAKFMNYLRKMTLFMLQKKSLAIDVIFNVSEKFPTNFEGDRERLEQILFNMLQNAVKYTEQGSIKLNAYMKNNKSIFEVSDTGCGMNEKSANLLFLPKDKKDYIIEPENMAKRGLSLTVAQMLCEKLGWKISVSTNVGKGTTFKLEIPYKTPQNIEFDDNNNFDTDRLLIVADENIRISTVKTREIKTMLQLPTKFMTARKDIILIVDDNEFNRMVAQKILAKYGFIIEEADDGKSAISKVLELQKINPDSKMLIFMDLSMPIMGGIEATEKIRGLNSQFKNKPFITALTAFASEAERNSCKEVGMDWFLSKPLTKESIEKVLTLSGLL